MELINNKSNVKPVLSFFTPTYGRDTSLRNTLTSIFNKWNLQDLHQVIISDNNENDLALNVIKEFDNTLVKYSRNVKNIGIDKNLLKFLDLCESKYCWLLGDDDEVTSTAYGSIAPFLKEEIDFLILLDGKAVEKYPEGLYSFKNNEDIGNFFLSFWQKMPFGNVIVNVERFKKTFDSIDMDRYLGTSHSYSGLIWETLLGDFSAHKVGVVVTKAVYTADIEKTWSKSSVLIHLKEIPRWFDQLPASIKKYVMSAKLNYLHSVLSFRQMFYYIKFQRESLENYQTIKELLKDKPTDILIRYYAALTLFPLYKVYKRLR